MCNADAVSICIYCPNTLLSYFEMNERGLFQIEVYMRNLPDQASSFCQLPSVGMNESLCFLIQTAILI